MLAARRGRLAYRALVALTLTSLILGSFLQTLQQAGVGRAAGIAAATPVAGSDGSPPSPGSTPGSGTAAGSVLSQLRPGSAANPGNGQAPAGAGITSHAGAVPAGAGRLSVASAGAQSAASAGAPPAGDQALACGDGSATTDTDGDGLPDATELCLGTDPYNADTAASGLPDGLKVKGFDATTTAGRPLHVVGDPFRADSSGDGIPDVVKWPSTSFKGQTYGQAASWDSNGNNVPNVWNPDIDGDNVPNSLDLSPFASTAYGTHFDLSMQSGGFKGYSYVELQVQPRNKDHLLFTNGSFDWPHGDIQGEIQHTGSYTDTLKLVPMLQIDTNAAPDSTLASHYNLQVKQNGTDASRMLVPLRPFGDGSVNYGYYAKVAYGPGADGTLPATIKWTARMVWLVQVKGTGYYNCPSPATPQAVGCDLQTRTFIAQTYSDPFRITGMNITKSQKYEAAVFTAPGTPNEDLDLFSLSFAMSALYLTNPTLPNQTAPTALQQVVDTLRNNPTGYAPWGIGQKVGVGYDGAAGHPDAGIARISEMTKTLLGDPGQANDCTDAAGNSFRCQSAVIAFEQQAGMVDLQEIAPTMDNQVISANVDLSKVGLTTTRGVRLQMYEATVDPLQGMQWQAMSAVRTLEVARARYSGASLSAIMGRLHAQYPDVQASDTTLALDMGYLGLGAGRVTTVQVDGQAVKNALNATTQSNFVASLGLLHDRVPTAIEFFGAVTDLYGAVQRFRTSSASIAALGGSGSTARPAALRTALEGHFRSGVEGLAFASAVGLDAVVLVEAIGSAVCKFKPSACGNALALEQADRAMRVIGSAATAIEAAKLAVQYAKDVSSSKSFLEMLPWKNMSKVGKGAAVAGIVVAIGLDWTVFGLSIQGSPAGSLTFDMALATAIAATIFDTVLFVLSLIPFVDIAVALFQIVDMIVNAATNGSYSISDHAIQALATGLLEIDQLTSIGDATGFTAINEGRDPAYQNPSLGPDDVSSGLMAGDHYLLTSTFTGALSTTKDGESFGRDKAFAATTLTSEYTLGSPDGSAAITNSVLPLCTQNGQEQDCTVVYTDTAVLATPQPNVHLQLTGGINYSIPYKECALHIQGVCTVKYSTRASIGGTPADIYLDVLPATVDDFWTWSTITNPLAGSHWVDPYSVDTTGDGLSNGLKWQSGIWTPTLQSTATDQDGDGLTDGQELCHWDAPAARCSAAGTCRCRGRSRRTSAPIR